MRKYGWLFLFGMTSQLCAQSVTTVVGYSVDSATQAFVFNTKTQTELNVSGNTTVERKFTFTNGEWADVSQETFEYSDSGLLVERVQTQWDGADWVNVSSQLYRYNSEGQEEVLTKQTWGEDGWQETWKMVILYTEGRVSSREQQNFDSVYGWVNSVREELSYREDGLQTVLSLFVWQNETWSLSSRTTSVFDASGNLLEELVDVNAGGVWQTFQKIVRTYTAANQVDTYEEAFWNGSEWVPSTRSQNTFDEQYRVVLTMFESYDDAGWAWMWKDEYDYQDLTSGLKLAVTPLHDFYLANNYPNPFNPSTEIRFHLAASSHVTLTVYNNLGKKVAVLANDFFASGLHTVSFVAMDLAAGNYFYRIEAGDFTDVKKMVLLK